MKHYRWLRLVAAVSVVAMVAVACGDDKDSDSGNGGDDNSSSVDGTLKVGALIPQTGDLAAIVKSLQTPIEMAIEEINAAGGVNGKDVVLSLSDDGTNPDVAKGSFDTLVSSDKVDAIVGPAPSGVALALMDKIKSNGIDTCSGSTTSAELSDADDGGYFFRTAPPDKFQGPALAQVVLGDGYSKVAIVTRNDSYGTGFGSALASALADGGAEVAINAAYDPAASDFKSDVSAVKDAGPDAVVVIGFSDDGGKIIKEMIAQGVGPADIPIYTADGMQGSSFYKGIDENDASVVEGIKGTAPAAAPNGVTSPFNDAFKEKGVDPIFSAYYYDCTMLIALAAQAAGSDDPAEIKDKMLEVSSGGEKCNTYADCLALLEDGKDIDYDGASGPVDLSDAGEPTSGVYDVWAYAADGSYSNVKDADQITISDSDLG